MPSNSRRSWREARRCLLECGSGPATSKEGTPRGLRAARLGQTYDEVMRQLLGSARSCWLSGGWAMRSERAAASRDQVTAAAGITAVAAIDSSE